MSLYKNPKKARARAMAILAKKGFLAKCVKCKGPDDRGQEDKLCSKCFIKEKKRLEAIRIREEAEEARNMAYKGKRGEWA